MAEVIETDVLVIGAGGAGTRAAIEANLAGAKVALVVKGRFALSGVRGSGATGYRGGSRPLHLFSVPRITITSKDEPGVYRRAPLEINGEQEAYYRRAIQAGLGMADPKLTRILVDDAREAKQMLDQWDIVLDKNPYIDCLIVPMPGLACAIRNKPDASVFDQIMITGLFIQDGNCVGALGIKERTSEYIAFKAKSTILATGGNAQLFMFNYHPSCVSGDGNVMGYEAGAELVNVEFGQVFIATVYPTINSIPYPLWKLHPRILNANMEEFIHNYLPAGLTVNECMNRKLEHGPFSSRDSSKYLEIAMMKETKAGRANANNAFYMEIGGFKPEEVGEAVSWQKEWLEYRGIDLQKEFVEINVSYHCSNGGLRIDENGETTIPNLYAVGELAAGPHGADRLGGAMMTSSQVFGMRAGRHAAMKSKTIKDAIVLNDGVLNGQIDRVDSLKKCTGSQKPFQFMKELKKTAWENLLVVRTEDSLLQLLGEIQNIRNTMDREVLIEDTSDLVAAIELRNMLQMGEIIAKVSRMRTESRGGHYRDDYPDRDDSNWLKSIRVMSDDGEMKLDTIRLDKEWQDKPDGFDGLWWG